MIPGIGECGDRVDVRPKGRDGIVLLAADGSASHKIARDVGVITGVVGIWRKRFGD
jgi:hypothetical protein